MTAIRSSLSAPSCRSETSCFCVQGYSLQQTGARGEEPIGLTAGAGFVLQRYRLDYAYASYPSLGIVHRLSVSGRI